jgi:hypothetical protein
MRIGIHRRGRCEAARIEGIDLQAIKLQEEKREESACCHGSAWSSAALDVEDMAVGGWTCTYKCAPIGPSNALKTQEAARDEMTS